MNYKTNYPVQSKEWGEFRKKTGIKVVQTHGLQITIHPIPYTPWCIGFLPKGPLPDKAMLELLTKIGKQEKCIFIQLEPNVEAEHGKNSQFSLLSSQLIPSAHQIFIQHTFILDLTHSEEELLKNMHPKTRYNIRVAQKHGVEVTEDNSDSAFKEYLRLTKETTTRQKYFAHSETYHRLMWETLKTENGKQTTDYKNKLHAHLFLAKYKGVTLAAWILFVYQDTLYYPYGASSNEHREAMASNLMMWEAIQYGKKLGLKKFDMWGSLGPNPNTKDSRFGFHRFKEGYGGKQIEYIGSYDLIINPPLYQLYKIANKLRWLVLKFKR